MPSGFSIYARLILPVMGAVAGWFVFEELIIAAVIAIIFGTVSWFSYKKRKNKRKNKTGKYFY